MFRCRYRCAQLPVPLYSQLRKSVANIPVDGMGCGREGCWRCRQMSNHESTGRAGGGTERRRERETKKYGKNAGFLWLGVGRSGLDLGGKCVCLD